MISDPARENELESTLTRDVCLAGIEDEVREPVKNSARPLNTEVPRVIEPVRILNIDVCLARVDDVLSEAVRSSARPLANMAAKVIDPVNDLAKPFVSEDVRVKDPTRILDMLFV